MKNIKWFYLIIGILLMFFSLDFAIRNLNVLKNFAMLIPILISIIYFFIGLNVLPFRRSTQVFAKFGFLPLVFILMLMLNEYIEHSSSVLKESFWYSHYGPFSQSEGFINIVPYFIVGVSGFTFILTGLILAVRKDKSALKQ